MSTVSVIVLIVVLLGALVCYAFISQTIAHKREQRQRMIAALKSRSRNFKFILSGFPTGFLPKELTVLVQRSLVETSEQLVELEPNEPRHMQDFQAVSAQMADSQKQVQSGQPKSLDSLQQIKEVKMCLEELHKFIFHKEGKKSLTRNQADHFRAQIKQLVLQVTVDGYVLSGQQARQNNKTKLAIHYFDLALNLLIREGKTGQFDGRIQQLREIIGQLKEQLTQESPEAELNSQEQAERDEVASEWDKFSEPDDQWKKKNVYD